MATFSWPWPNLKTRKLQAAMEVALKVPVIPVKAAEAEIWSYFRHAYEPGGPMSRLVGDLEAEELDVESEETAEIGHSGIWPGKPPSSSWSTSWFLRAIQWGPVISTWNLLKMRSGFATARTAFLYEAESPPKGLQAAVLSRLKIMARLDIAERRLPQDGRFR